MAKRKFKCEKCGKPMRSAYALREHHVNSPSHLVGVQLRRRRSHERGLIRNGRRDLVTLNKLGLGKEIKVAAPGIPKKFVRIAGKGSASRVEMVDDIPTKSTRAKREVKQWRYCPHCGKDLK